MKLFQVDSFTDEPFKGNPAGVCISKTPFDTEFMQNIAMEMNLSETAFVTHKHGTEFDLKWFTPETEVNLCGHATLATAYILFEKEGISKDDSITFNTLSGQLKARFKDEAVELDFPKGIVHPTQPTELLKRAFNISPADYFEGDTYYLILFHDQDDILNLKPDLAALKHTNMEIIVTAQSNNPKYDYVNRFFAPCLGIDEDPVTGSAHCYLAPFWSERLNKNPLIGFQASKRTGTLTCRVDGDRVFLFGKAVIMMEMTTYLHDLL